MNKGGQANDWTGVLKEENVTSVTKNSKILSFPLFLIFGPKAGTHVGSLALGILVFCPGTKPGSPALAAQNLNHWTAREVPILSLNKT